MLGCCPFRGFLNSLDLPGPAPALPHLRRKPHQWEQAQPRTLTSLVVLTLLWLFGYVAPHWEPTSFLSLLRRLSVFTLSVFLKCKSRAPGTVANGEREALRGDSSLSRKQRQDPR